MSAAPHAFAPDRSLSLQATTVDAEGEIARATYRELRGLDAGEATIDTDDDFDAHILASILAVASIDEGGMCRSTGLPSAELASLLAHWFPRSSLRTLPSTTDALAVDDELLMVCDLLLASRSTEGETGRWLAYMVARRALEPSHLWEDLGLRNRAELSRMLERHFAPLAIRNTRNMRWKRFFYRVLCEDEGSAMCMTPVCTDCCDFESCFGAEDGESRLAYRRRDADLLPAITEFSMTTSSALRFRHE
jgi:nitrogen fixation protein NifQ